MIVFKRLGGGELIALNPDLIERVEATPDTVVTMLDEKKFLVAESLEEVLDLITDYRAYVIARANNLSLSEDGGRPTLHVVPNEHITSDENIETYGTDLDGVDLGFDPEPDGRVHLEFRPGRYDLPEGAQSADQHPQSEPFQPNGDAVDDRLDQEMESNTGQSGFGFGFGGRG